MALVGSLINIHVPLKAGKGTRVRATYTMTRSGGWNDVYVVILNSDTEELLGSKKIGWLSGKESDNDVEFIMPEADTLNVRLELWTEMPAQYQNVI